MRERRRRDVAAIPGRVVDRVAGDRLSRRVGRDDRAARSGGEVLHPAIASQYEAGGARRSQLAQPRSRERGYPGVETVRRQVERLAYEGVKPLCGDRCQMVQAGAHLVQDGRACRLRRAEGVDQIAQRLRVPRWDRRLQHHAQRRPRVLRGARHEGRGRTAGAVDVDQRFVAQRARLQIPCVTLDAIGRLGIRQQHRVAQQQVEHRVRSHASLELFSEQPPERCRSDGRDVVRAEQSSVRSAGPRQRLG